MSYIAYLRQKQQLNNILKVENKGREINDKFDDNDDNDDNYETVEVITVSKHFYKKVGESQQHMKNRFEKVI